jgi:hypothetical protein
MHDARTVTLASGPVAPVMLSNAARNSDTVYLMRLPESMGEYEHLQSKAARRRRQQKQAEKAQQAAVSTKTVESVSKVTQNVSFVVLRSRSSYFYSVDDDDMKLVDSKLEILLLSLK